MRNIFELTRSEQRVIIFIVVVLVAAAFTQHFLETRSRPVPATSTTSSPTASPTIHPEEEPEAADSR